MPAVAPTYQETLDVHRRRLIVEAARRVFEAAGLEGASIRAIAQAAGCTTVSIYPLFRSKEERVAGVSDGLVSGGHSGSARRDGHGYRGSG